MLVIKNLKTKLFSKGYSSVSVVARLAVAAAPATSAQLRHSHSRTPWSVRRKTRGIRRTEGQTPYTENRPSVALTHTQTHSMPLPTTRLSHGTSNKSWTDAELRIGNAGAHCPRVFQHRMKSDTLAPPLLLDPSLQHKTGENWRQKGYVFQAPFVSLCMRKKCDVSTLGRNGKKCEAAKFYALFYVGVFSHAHNLLWFGP